jgi:hypothetical protein
MTYEFLGGILIGNLEFGSPLSPACLQFYSSFMGLISPPKNAHILQKELKKMSSSFLLV